MRSIQRTPANCYACQSTVGSGPVLQFILAGSSTPRLFLPQLIEWYKIGRFPVDRLVKTFAFEEINEAWAESVAGRAVKPVLLMS